MKVNTKRLLLALAAALVCTNLFAGPFQTVSVSDPSLVPASGGGDSLAPMMTPDGRFVVFSSTAINLATNANGAPLSPTFPAKLNVFLRDRTTGTTTLISANQSQLNGGNGDSLPDDISTNGQFVAFESSASDLVTNDTNNGSDIFLRDAVNGATSVISIAADGSAANGVSSSAVMSPDGRYIAFVSAATNLVSGDSNNIPDVFLRDTWSNTTTLISVGAKATGTLTPLTNSCESPEITPDGRYVAFFSTATNLVPGGTNTGQIYVRDTVAGTTICASIDAQAIVTTNFPNTRNGICYDHCISADGQFVAYQANPIQTFSNTGYPVGVALYYNVATGTTDIIDTNAFVPIGSNEEIRTLDMTPDGRFVVYLAYVGRFNYSLSSLTTGVKVWDSQTGVSTVVSGNTNTYPVQCDAPSIDPTGRFVTFISNAPDVISNSVPPGYHCYIRDLQSNTTTLVDVNTNGATASLLPTTLPRLSVDARYVAFTAFDNQLVPGDFNHAHDIFVRDLASGGIDLISAREASLTTPSTAANLSASEWSVSTDGRFVAFSSLAENLATNDNNNTRDIFVRDLLTSTTTLVSRSTNGTGASSASYEPSISGDGRFVAFSTYATNIAYIQIYNYWENVYLADLQTGGVTIISKAANGSPGNGNSHSPLLSTDGQYLLFRSKASNISTNPASFYENLFLRYVQSSNTVALTTGGVTNAAMTPDGRYVIFSGYVQGIGNGLFMWDTVKAARIYTNLSVGIPSVLAISANASHFCYVSNSLYDNVSGLVASSVLAGRPQWPIRYSADGRLLTFCGPLGRINVYNTQTHSTSIVSHSLSSNFSPANGISDTQDISANGRYIVYRSTASDLVATADPVSTNGWPRLFMFDTTTGSNSVFSVGQFVVINSGGPPPLGSFQFLRATTGNFRSSTATFSPDGRSVVFSSWASDLVDADFNQTSDVFEYAFLYADVTTDVTGQGVIVSWPVAPHQTYHVEYKENVDDPAWQTLNGTITVTGNRASITDTAANSDHRIYRVATSLP